MNAWARVPVLILVLLGGCVTEPPWEQAFHSEVVNGSTQDDVRKKFGEPELVTPLDDGGSIWTYRYVRGTYRTGYTAGAECWQYSLTFDAQKVLRSSKELDCSGELKGYDPASDEKYLQRLHK